MTCCERDPDIERMVDEVLRLIDEEWLSKRIHRPLQVAAAAFDMKGRIPSPLSSRTFLDLAAEFIAHLYRYGFSYSIRLTSRQARAEAAFILEHAYQGHQADGYVGALKDAQTLGETGIASVFAAMVDALARTQRQRYVRWVMTNNVLCLPWPVRRDLAGFILERWGSLFPPLLRQCSPEQIAEFCAELIQALANSDHAVRELLARPIREASRPPAIH